MTITIYDLACCTILLINKHKELGGDDMANFLDACKVYFFVPIILDLYYLIILVSVGPLCCFHIYLVCTAQTTREVFPAPRLSQLLVHPVHCLDLRQIDSR